MITRRGLFKVALAGSALYMTREWWGGFLDGGAESGTDLSAEAPDTAEPTADNTPEESDGPSPAPDTDFKDQKFYVGPDTSEFQKRYLDYERLADQGVAFAFARAGYWILDKDKRHTDTLFAGSRERMHDAGLIPGSYYFIRNDGNPKQQAEHYIEILRDTDPIKKNRGSIANIKGFLALDLEPSPSDGTKPTHDDSTGFRAKIEELVPGYTVLEYSYRNYWRTILKAAVPNSEAWVAIPSNGGSNPYAAARKIAEPGSRNDPYRQVPWRGYKNWTIRQYSAGARLQGFKALDFNITFASIDKLLTLARMERSEIRLPGKLADKP